MEYIQPAELTAYMEEHQQMSSERRKLFPGWCGSWKTELGGQRTEVYELYHWKSFAERDAARKAATDNPQWYLDDKHSDMHVPSSNMTGVPFPTLRRKLTYGTAHTMLEATECLASAGLKGASGFSVPAASNSTGMPVWERRSYQLVLGYSTVPKFLDLYSEGLRDKLAVDDSGASTLVTLLYSDCGSLNVVHELWRHESMQRAQDSRIASRKAAKWRSAVDRIAQLATSFETRYVRSLSGAPWQ